MRLAVGVIMHEADIFSPVKTTLKSCRESYLLFNEDIIRFHQNRETELGGVIRIASQEDIDLILTENRIPAWEPDFLRKFQIEPTEKRVLVIKGCGPRYRELTENIFGVDTPGYFHSRLILEWIKRERIPLSWNYWEQGN